MQPPSLAKVPFLVLALACTTGEVGTTTGPGTDPPGTDPPDPPAPSTGSLQVNVETIGDMQDLDGYTFLLDGTEEGTLLPMDDLLLADLAEGAHAVKLEGVADNCRVTNIRNPSAVVIAVDETEVLRWIVFCLSPNPGRIFFVKNAVEIHSMPALGGYEPFVTTGTRLSVSTDGSRIAFTPGFNEDIWIANPSGSGLTNVTPTGTIRELDPALSANGSKIVYEALEGGIKDVFSINANGTGKTQLTDLDTTDGDAAWSPDGSQIVFRSHREPTPDGDLYIMDADGGNVTPLFTGDDLPVIPQWSPDGTKIAYVAMVAGNWEILTIAPDGTGRTQLTSRQGTSTEATWSPDGRWITFASNRTGSFQIFAMRSDGTDVVQLTLNGGDQPNWGGGN